MDEMQELREIHHRHEGRPALELRAPERTVSRCLVCGSREVRTDEVADGGPWQPRTHRGWVLLAECRHCDHRWTRPLPDEAAARAAPVRRRPAREAADAEVASAA